MLLFIDRPISLAIDLVGQLKETNAAQAREIEQLKRELAHARGLPPPPRPHSDSSQQRVDSRSSGPPSRPHSRIDRFHSTAEEGGD